MKNAPRARASAEATFDLAVPESSCARELLWTYARLRSGCLIAEGTSTQPPAADLVDCWKWRQWAISNNVSHRLHVRQVQTAVQGRKARCLDIARKWQMHPISVPVNKVKLASSRRHRIDQR